MPREDTFRRALRRELVEAFAQARMRGGDEHDVRCEVIGWLLSKAGAGLLSDERGAFNEEVDDRMLTLAQQAPQTHGERRGQ